MMRPPLIVGNWKMELSHKGSLELVRALKKLLKNVEATSDVVLCPSYPSLAEVAEAVENSDRLQVGAQNIHWQERGAFTGSVAVTQIASFVDWCIVGHSEARQLTGESDEEVVQKIGLLLTHGIAPVVCIGETQQEREAGETVSKVTRQAEGIFAAIARSSLTKLVVTYEPIWAISANHPGALPDPHEVAELMVLIRKIAAAKFGRDATERLRILYGGSVKPENVTPYVSEPGVDGVLVGGASVHPLQFVDIIKQVQSHAR